MSVKLNYMECDGVSVPFGQDGEVYDWELSTPENPVAAHSPFGRGAFAVGSSTAFFNPDFVILPDQRFHFSVRRGVANHLPDPNQWLHPEDLNTIAEVGSELEAAFRLTEHLLMELEGAGHRHDTEFHNADAWYFMRAVGYCIGHPKYVDMTPEELKRGR